MCCLYKNVTFYWFSFLRQNINYSGYVCICQEGDIPGKLKLSFLPWIRHCVIKNNPALKQILCSQQVLELLDQGGKKSLRIAREEGPTDPTTGMRPEFASTEFYT